MPAPAPTEPRRQPQPLAVDQTEAARLLSVPVRTLRQWTSDGKIASGKVGKRRLYQIDELRRVAGGR